MGFYFLILLLFLRVDYVIDYNFEILVCYFRLLGCYNFLCFWYFLVCEILVDKLYKFFYYFFLLKWFRVFEVGIFVGVECVVSVLWVYSYSFVYWSIGDCFLCYGWFVSFFFFFCNFDGYLSMIFCLFLFVISIGFYSK